MHCPEAVSPVVLENVPEGHLKGVWVPEALNNDNECTCTYKTNNFIYHTLNSDLNIFQSGSKNYFIIH